MSSQQPATNSAQEQEAEKDFPNKVFVGNLPFNHTEAQLEELFVKFGKIVNTQIISHARKSHGYGFVAFETKEDAVKAVAEMHEKDVDGRALNVELARPKVPRTGRPSRGGKPRRPRRKPESSTKPDEVSSEVNNPTEKEDKASGDKTIRSSNSRRGGRGGRRPSSRRTPKPTGTPSPTTLFVANLPFSLSDEGLQQVFESFDVVSAHVVRRSRSGQSKGFGFVELKSTEEQQRVLKDLDEVEINGRVLNISVAHSEPYVAPAEEEISKE